MTRREDESSERPAVTAMEACAQIALQRGEFADVRATERVAAIERVKSEGAAETEGFNVHAVVRIERDDDMGREKLCRYGARPAFAMDRIQRIPGGRIAYRTKAARGQRARCRIMTPIEFLARLAALIPPPRHPLLRFHGVLAPKSSWRKEVVPKPRAAQRAEKTVRRTLAREGSRVTGIAFCRFARRRAQAFGRRRGRAFCFGERTVGEPLGATRKWRADGDISESRLANSYGCGSHGTKRHGSFYAA